MPLRSLQIVALTLATLSLLPACASDSPASKPAPKPNTLSVAQQRARDKKIHDAENADVIKIIDLINKAGAADDNSQMITAHGIKGNSFVVQVNGNEWDTLGLQDRTLLFEDLRAAFIKTYKAHNPGKSQVYFRLRDAADNCLTVPRYSEACT